MKPRFFSTFSALIAIATLFPVQSAASKAVTHRLKQPRTTVPVGGTNNNPNNNPFGGQNNNGLEVIEIDPTTAPVTTLTLHHTRQGAGAGHTEQYANYKTWDGGNWTARINSAGQFTHTRQGAGSSHTDTVIHYISWDGQDWVATINPTNKVFTHTRRDGSTSHTDTILNYVGWDGSQWTMRLQ